MQELEADLVLWTAGSQPSSKATPNMNLPFPLTDKGAMKTEDSLQVVGNPHVFALGDVASSASEGQELTSLPATAQVLTHRLMHQLQHLPATPGSPCRHTHYSSRGAVGRATSDYR